MATTPTSTIAPGLAERRADELAGSSRAIDSLTLAEGWWAVQRVHVPSLADPDRGHWARHRVVAFAVVVDGIGCAMVRALVVDGASTTLAPAHGHLVHADEMPTCTCPTSERGGTLDPGWCSTCAGIIEVPA